MAVPVDLDIDAFLDATDDKRSLPLTTNTENGDIDMASIPLSSGPLEGFVKLNDKVHLYTPSSKPDKDSNDPAFLLMCSWAFAQPRHVSKYIKTYQSIYPSMQILLVQIEINNMLFRSDAAQRIAYFNTAARSIRSYIESIGSATPRILLQTYSNGGSHSAVQTAEAYKLLFGTDLPLSAIVMDSAPGEPHWMETVNALLQGLPQTFLAQALGAICLHSTLVVTGFMHHSGIAELATVKLYRTLNDENEAFLKAHIPRTYIHSETDTMILSKDVIAHAETARRKLAEKGAADDMIRVEMFVDTVHVQHMSKDPARYWQIVTSTWDKARR